MKFCNAALLARDARDRGYAVPAFNTNSADYDITRAALEAAQATRSPLILQEYEPNAAYRGFEYFVLQTRHLCDQLGVTVPVAIHLDHGHSIGSVMRAIRAGFTSVMIDASHEPLEANAALTRQVIGLAHPIGVSVEAEIGYVAGNEKPAAPQIGRIPVAERPERSGARVTPEEAAQFLSLAPVDLLAVAVGSTHGIYVQQPGLDIALIEAIRARVDVPLVQHGTGGLTLAQLSQATKAGMAKVNFGEVFRYGHIRHFLDIVDHEEHLWHPWRVLEKTKNRLRDDMIGLIGALGSGGKA